jgi:transcription elongation factor GreA
MFDKLTEEDIRKMQEEIDYRKFEVRPKALEDLKAASEQGDRSENFEYYAAKRFKNKNESRIRYLEKMIATATVIKSNTAEGVVSIDNTVEIEYLEDGEIEQCKIVTTVRADSLENRITPESPLGKALMGRKVGDVVTVKVDADYQYEVRILNVIKTDGSGDAINSY